jgi:RNA polymerase sigma-70 factor (ECF subfamily)
MHFERAISDTNERAMVLSGDATIDASTNEGPPASMPRMVVRSNDDAASTAANRREDDERAIATLLATGESRTAIAKCARLHGASIGRLAFALTGSQADADEVTQETLLAAYDAASSFRGEGSVRAWLFGIARRVCARKLEVRTRQARRAEMIVALGDDARGVDALVDEQRTGARVRTALEAMRPTEREAVVLRYERDLSFREVAEACGIDEAAARKRVGRALDRLRVLIGATEVQR